MYWLSELCVKRPVFALMLIMALVVAGLAAFPGLGVDRFPSMDLPTVYVRTSYPGAASVEVESEVSQIIEDAVATVAGIDELRSISNDGQSFVIATFNLNRDPDAAVQDVRGAVASVINRLPRGLDPPVIMQQDTDSSPIMTVAVSGPRSSTELYLLADRYVKNIVESAEGIGAVTIAGAADRAVQVRIDASRLAAHRLSIMQVREALVSQNAEVPGGRVDEGIRERSLRTLGRVPHSREFPDLVVATVNGMPVRLSDLGTVEDSTKEVRTMARLNGKPAVVLQFQRQSGENTVRVIESVKERLQRSRTLLPDDIEIEIIQDQSRYILAALHEIEGHLILGSILACLTVLAFMRSWRSTIIASVAIPTSIIATFPFMRAFDFTLNNVTMLALVLMVGVVIDDAIVVLENVFHCIEEKGMDPMEAAVVGTREIGLAVLATTVSLVIVFLPVSFLSSVTGKMLYEFGVTATVSIMVSMLVSFSLTPMMCSRMLKPAAKTGGHQQPASRQGFYQWIENSYMWFLRISMRHRWIVLLLSLLVIASNIPLYHMIQQDYIPTNVDESEFEVRLEAKEGASLVATNAAMLKAEEVLRNTDGVVLTLATVGTRGFGGVNRGEVYVRLQDIESRTFSLGRFWRGLFRGDPGEAFRGNFTQQDVMAEARKKLVANLPGVRASVRNLTSLRQGAPVDIDFAITGPDIIALAKFADKVRNKAEAEQGHVLVDLYTTLRLDKPELLAHIDRERAAALGVSVQEIADTLRVAVGGDDRVSRYRDALVDDAYDVELRLIGVDRGDVESISQLYVRGNPSPRAALRSSTANDTPTGQILTRLDNIVSFDIVESVARVDRLDRQRAVNVRANVSREYALQDGLDAMYAVTEEIGLPPGFDTRVLGGGRELAITINDFIWTFMLSFVFMYIVLAAQYEHLIHPLTILFVLPVSVPFGLISLLWGGETLNLYSALGILVLFGVVKKAAILQVDHTNALRARGMPRDQAILQANRDRLRPILMTTLAFVAGLLPLLVGSGPGAEERRSIAVLAVGGQTLSLLLTLLAVPVVYSYLDDLAQLFRPVTAKAKEPERLTTHAEHITASAPGG